jgi:hypothetical protein
LAAQTAGFDRDPVVILRGAALVAVPLFRRPGSVPGYLAVQTAGVDRGPVVILRGAAVVAVPLFRRLGPGSVPGYLAAGLQRRVSFRASG